MSADLSTDSASPLDAIVELERRGWRARLAVAAVVGLIIGAVTGGLVFNSLRTASTATAFIRITQPVDLTALAAGANQTTPETGDGTKNYVAGELAYLSGQGFAQAIARQLGEPGHASIIVSRAGDSAVVSISNRSETPEQARAIVQAAIDIYDQQLDRAVDEQVRSIMPTLDQWQALDAGQPARIGEITALRESILLQAAEARTVTVLQPPTAADPSLSRWMIGMQLGGVLGAAIAVLIVMRRSRRAGHPYLAEQVAAATDLTLLPAVNTRRRWDSDQASTARILYTQCVAPLPGRSVALLGATPGSDAAVVMSMFEAAAADQDPAVLLDAGAGAPSASTYDDLRRADAVVVVTRLNHDTSADAQTVCRAAAAGGGPVMAVFTYRPWWSSWTTPTRRRRGRRPARVDA